VQGRERHRYYCPTCLRKTLTVRERDGMFSCWAGCARRDILRSLGLISTYVPSASSPYHHKNQYPYSTGTDIHDLWDCEGEKLPEPEHLEFVRIVPPPGPYSSSVRGNGEEGIETLYWYSPEQYVRRIDIFCESGQRKVVYPMHWDGKKWAVGKGSAPWPPYMLSHCLRENVNPYANAILVVEGEKCVRALTSIGIGAITLQGSEWHSDEAMTFLFDCLGALYPVFLRDEDEPGMRKAEWVANHRENPYQSTVVLSPCDFIREPKEGWDAADILSILPPPAFLAVLSQAANERLNA